MKTLFLLRHGKSSWDDARLADEERPLTPKGIHDAGEVAGWLSRQGVKPGLIIASPAKRAYETALIVAGRLDYPKEKIRVEPKVYEGDYEELPDLLYGLDDALSSVMIVGHNPAITLFANLYVKPALGPMKTSAVAGISFRSETWSGIPLSHAKLEMLINPKMLKEL